jgi:secondary thiamine-phosphate synthase enzyme
MPEFLSHSDSFTVSTRGKGTYEITDEVAEIVRRGGVREGTVTVFIRHTSASLILFENADPSAREDLHAFFERLVPEDQDYFVHTLEGSDDMPSHLRMVLTRDSEVIPVQNGRMTLGTWQGIFVFEHRARGHQRQIAVNVMGVG